MVGTIWYKYPIHVVMNVVCYVNSRASIMLAYVEWRCGRQQPIKQVIRISFSVA
jgi:hypothetical protein